MKNNLVQTVPGHFENDDYVFFWNGPFSNWHTCDFTMSTDLGTIQFSSSEQAMMYFKAMTFGDAESGREILATNSPREQKAIGRKVKNFDSAKWDAVCVQIVTDILVHKFNSDDKLKAILLNTNNKHIVEASPFDTIWGIGMGVDNPDVLDQSLWNGKNYLGICLMNAREIIRNG